MSSPDESNFDQDIAPVLSRSRYPRAQQLLAGLAAVALLAGAYEGGNLASKEFGHHKKASNSAENIASQAQSAPDQITNIPDVKNVPIPPPPAGINGINIAPNPAQSPNNKPAPKPATQPTRTHHKPRPKPPLNKNIYVVGDSYLELAKENGLASVVAQAGGKLTSNGVVGRTITSEGQGGQSGMQALEADTGAIRSAGAIVVELGTNGGDDSSSIKEVTSTIRSNNATAPIYWVNIGTLGYPPSENQQATMSNFNVENTDLVRASKIDGFHILNWCGVVFGGSPETCINSFSRLHSDMIGPDDVHPSIGNGLPQFDNLIVSAIPK